MGFDLSPYNKAVERLVDRVSDFIGGALKPFQIKRVAKADADASIIKAEAEATAKEIIALSDFKINELEARALTRQIKTLGTEQRNIEKITSDSFKHINKNSQPENLDQDWLSMFYEKCKSTSDEEMQSLWARILAGEANSPGKFSRRTIEFIYTMDKEDAEAFTNFCRFNVVADNANLPYIDSFEKEIYSKNGLTYANLVHLESIGLINFMPHGGYISNRYPQLFNLSYFDQSIEMCILNPTEPINTGLTSFTRIGFELSTICHTKPIDGFFEHVQSSFIAQRVLPKSEVNL